MHNSFLRLSYRLSEKSVDTGNIFSKCRVIQYSVRSLFSRPSLNATHQAKDNFTAKQIRMGGLIHNKYVYTSPFRDLTNEICTNISVRNSKNFFAKKYLEIKIRIRFINRIVKIYVKFALKEWGFRKIPSL